MVKVIGLTGGIASGKSTVSRMLKKMDYAVIDADIAARAAVEPGEPAHSQIVEAFGEDILQPDGTLNRAKLGERVFNDEAERKKLNEIVHPAVRRKMLEEKAAAVQSGKQTIFMDIPLLFESRLTWMVDKVIVVFADKEVQLRRLMARNGLDEQAAKARIASQLPLSDKVRQADAVIDNNGTIEETRKQLLQCLDGWQLQP
ncbi:dephospho-CoA kinase [Bacillus xiapuensis]|uniref:dephospho-CoA kinase n=1 Tax=Bacillus xiapuensis TaxID=2014075 RepID=UPI000C23C292|nr:dephospho-CoA kinase [Bacillus xiapuensis]